MNDPQQNKIILTNQQLIKHQAFHRRLARIWHWRRHPAQAATAHRLGLGPRFAPPVPGVRYPRNRGPVDLRHAARRKHWVTAWQWLPLRKDVSGSTPGVPPLVAQLVEPPERGCRRFDSCPGPQGLNLEVPVERPTRRTRGVAQGLCWTQAQGQAPSAGGGLRQHPAQPAPAASQTAARPRSSTPGAVRGPRLRPLGPRHRCNGNPMT